MADDAPAPAACPKCGADQPAGAAACARCGLAAGKMAGFAAQRDAAVPPAVVEGWEHAVAGWDDPARHDALLGLCTRHDAYAWVAAQYRTRAGDPVADRELARIRKATEVTLLAGAAARKQPEAKPYRALIAVLLLMFVAVVGGLVFVRVLSDHAASPSAPVGGK